MQRLLRLASTRNASSNSLLRSQPPLKPFSPLHRPIPPPSTSSSSSPCPIKQQSLGFFSTCTSSSSLPKSHLVFSNPVVLPKCFRTVSHLRLSSLSSGGGVRFFRSELSKRGFRYGPFSFTSYYGRWSSWFSRLSSDDLVLWLILANVAVFMLWRVADQSFMFKNFTLSLDNIKSGRVYTVITSAFSHIDVGHIISNMLGLYFFGTSIGRYFGSKYLVKLYIAGALGGSVFYLVQHALMSSSSKGGLSTWNRSTAPALGASGAVNAIMLLNIFLYPRATLYLDFIIPIPAILLGIFIIGKDMLRILEGDQHISGAAHLGGAVVAAIAWKRIKMGRF